MPLNKMLPRKELMIFFNGLAKNNIWLKIIFINMCTLDCINWFVGIFNCALERCLLDA